MIVPPSRGVAAFGGLAISVQLGTAAYLMNAALAWVGAAILLVFARELTRKSA